MGRTGRVSIAGPLAGFADGFRQRLGRRSWRSMLSAGRAFLTMLRCASRDEATQQIPRRLRRRNAHRRLALAPRARLDTASEYDRVLFDTAPTGHTLRLLTLPSAWGGYAQDHPAGASCLGPLAGLERQRRQYQDAVATLADPTLTSLVLVARAEASALHEAARASYELGQLGVKNQQLVINGVLRHPGSDPTARAFAERQQLALTHAPGAVRQLPTGAVDMIAGDITGIPALEQLVSGTPAPDVVAEPSAPTVFDELDALIDDLDAAGQGVVLTMGKGGVGKTTIAAAIAVALADRGHQVTLSTTDPAAHLAAALGDETQIGLQVERIDPAAETARYSAEVLHAAAGLAAEGRALLEEDLRSPCTEEIAVFRAFARTIDQANDRIVILDTAPTGHTLLLLDAAESYQREIKRTNANVPDAVRKLAQRLRDPQFAHVIIVTLAESTPVHEAERLQADLRRAGIEPFGCPEPSIDPDVAQVSSSSGCAFGRGRRVARVHGEGRV